MSGVIRNPRACIFVFGISQRENTVSLYIVQLSRSWGNEWKEYFEDIRFEEHFVPHFRFACTNSKPVVQVASGNTCVHAYLSLMRTASRAYIYIYLAHQRIEFPYLHRPLRFFSRNAEWSREVFIMEWVKRVSLQWCIWCVVNTLKIVLSKAIRYVLTVCTVYNSRLCLENINKYTI